MSRITNLRVVGNNITAHFDSDDIYEVNMLRRSIMGEIETYAIEEVTFHINTSARNDEIIALRLGQLVIDHTQFVFPENGLKVRVDFRGPGTFTTNDIPGIPFAHATPIAELRADQRILCDVSVSAGIAYTHAKWCPVSKFFFQRLDRGYDITVKSVGMLAPEEIFRQGLLKFRDAAARNPDNIFFRAVVPHNIEPLQ